MQIVIEIDDELYDALGKAPYIKSGDEGLDNLLTAIKNGTPLPKGHGRLVDGDDLWNRMSYYSDNEGAGDGHKDDDVNPIILRDSAMEVIENAPTIITATKGE